MQDALYRVHFRHLADLRHHRVQLRHVANIQYQRDDSHLILAHPRIDGEDVGLTVGDGGQDVLQQANPVEGGHLDLDLIGGVGDGFPLHLDQSFRMRAQRCDVGAVLTMNGHPRPRVTYPMMRSPGSGVQHREKRVRTVSAPRTRTPPADGPAGTGTGTAASGTGGSPRSAGTTDSSETSPLPSPASRSSSDPTLNLGAASRSFSGFIR